MTSLNDFPKTVLEEGQSYTENWEKFELVAKLHQEGQCFISWFLDISFLLLQLLKFWWKAFNQATVFCKLIVLLPKKSSVNVSHFTQKSEIIRTLLSNLKND